MKPVHIFCSIILFFSSCKNKDFKLLNIKTNTREDILTAPSDTIQTFCFLSYHCPLALRQLERLQLLVDKYQGLVNFTIIIPEKYGTDSKLLNKSGLLNVTCDAFLDETLNASQSFNATVTPEYIVWHNNDIVYQGTFDNTYTTLNTINGKQTYINYVDQALDELIHNKSVTIEKTKPIGCFIE